MNKILFLLFICAATPVVAQPLIHLYPEAKVVNEEVIDNTSYSLALGALKKVNAEWVSEKEHVVRGTLHRKTVELPSGVSEYAALAEIETEAKRQGGYLVFACEGLDCGSSNAWANTRFETKQLYGMDQTQSYRVWEFDSGDTQYIGVAYTVKRGNRRTYAHVDVLAPSGKTAHAPLVASSKAIAVSLEGQGYFVFRGMSFQAGDTVLAGEYIDPLVKLLRSKPLLKLTLIGHDYSAEGSADKSLAYAGALKAELVERGVKEHRLTAVGVGDTEPRGVKAAPRIELRLK